MALALDITQNLEGQGLNELRAHLKAVNLEMDILRKADPVAHRQSNDFIDLRNRAFDVSKAIQGVTRENKGLEASMPIRPTQELNNKLRDAKDALYLLIKAKKTEGEEWEKAKGQYATNIKHYADLYNLTSKLRMEMGGSMTAGAMYANIIQKLGMAATQAAGGLGSFFNISQIFNSAVTNITGATGNAATGIEKVGSAATTVLNPALIASGVLIGALVIGVFGAVKAIDFLSESFVKLINFIEPGATFNVLNNNFEEISGGSRQAKDDLDLFNKALAYNIPDDGKVMQLANSYRLLGLDVKTTAQVFDFAERNQEKLGGSIEQIIEKVRRFAVTGSGKGFEKFGANINDINAKIRENTGLTDKQIKALDQEEKARVGMIAFMDLYGNSLDKIKNKQLDEADTIAKLKKEYAGTKLEIQSFLSSALAPAITEILKLTGTIKSWLYEMVGGQKGVDDLKAKVSDLALNGVKYLTDLIVKSLPTIKDMITWLGEAGKKAYQFGKDILTVTDALALLVKYTSPIKGLADATDKLFGQGTAATVFFRAIEYGAKAAFMPLIALYKIITAVARGIREVSARYQAFQRGDYGSVLSGNFITPESGEHTGSDISPDGDVMGEHGPNRNDFIQPSPKIKGSDGSKSQKESKEKEKNATDELIKSIERELKTKEHEISLNEKNKIKLNDLLIEQQALYKSSIDKLNTELAITKDLDDRIKLTDKLVDLTKKLETTGRAEGRRLRPENGPSEQTLRPRASRNGDANGIEVVEKEIGRTLKEEFDIVVGGFGNIMGKTQNMLEKFGLMDSIVGEIVNGFAQVIAMLQSAFDVGSGIFDFITGVISLIPGGGAVGAIAKAAGSISGSGGNSAPSIPLGGRPSSLSFPLFERTNKLASKGMINRPSQAPKVDVIVNTKLEKRGKYQVYVDGKEIADNRSAKKTLG